MTSVLILAWIAQSSTFVGQSSFPPITAEAAIAVHIDTGRILWGRNIDRPMYPASTTKLLTTYILLQDLSPTDIITAPDDVKSVRGSSLHLLPGEQITAEAAAYALMLRSANDVGYSIAKKISGSETGFAKRMNQVSQELGLKNSNWVTPHGLNNDWHKTTARDLSKLVIAGSKNDQLVEIATTEKYTITRSLNQKDTLLQTRNKLLAEDPRIKGFKTGYTNPAGLCFVGYWQTEIGPIATVVLNSRDWAADELALANWTESNFNQKDNIGDTNKINLPVAKAKENQTLTAKLKKPISAIASEEDIQNLQIILQQTQFVAPIQAGQSLGSATVQFPDGTSFPAELVAVNSVDRQFDIRELLENPIGIGLIIVASLTYWYRRRNYERLNSY